MYYCIRKRDFEKLPSLSYFNMPENEINFVSYYRILGVLHPRTLHKSRLTTLYSIITPENGIWRGMDVLLCLIVLENVFLGGPGTLPVQCLSRHWPRPLPLATPSSTAPRSHSAPQRRHRGTSRPRPRWPPVPPPPPPPGASRPPGTAPRLVPQRVHLVDGLELVPQPHGDGHRAPLRRRRHLRAASACGLAHFRVRGGAAANGGTTTPRVPRTSRVAAGSASLALC